MGLLFPVVGWDLVQIGLGKGPSGILASPPVSKTVKAAVPPSESPIPFEEALQKLESIVDSMEAGDLSLEQLLGRFEEGARLAKSCQAQLEAADVRVQLLERTLAGDLTTRSADLSGEGTGS